MKFNTEYPGTAQQPRLVLGAGIIALWCVAGCGASVKDKAPVANVEVTLARRAPISETISAEALVFPLQQAILTPKITSTIKTFEVQRGSHVRKGQLLAVLENADLSAAS